MQRTLQDFCAVAFCAVGFSIFFLPPGYLFAHAFNLNAFRIRSFPEKLLWGVSLSTPLSILLVVFEGRHLSFQASQSASIGLALLFLLLLGWNYKTGKRDGVAHWDRPAKVAALVVLLLSIYCIVATLGITVGHKLYEGAYAGDWSVRIPLTAAATRSGLPIPTPFYGIDGSSSSLRYYYYWYVLCGAAARLTHSTARAALAASGIWSALALFSTLFLYAKYLFIPTEEDSKAFSKHILLRARCCLMFLVSCILGLDILPAIAALMMHPFRLYPELEWWRSAGDYSLSFHTAILYAPHHAAGLVCCLMGFLFLAFCASQTGRTNIPWTNAFIYVMSAALCFSAAIGTSTYLTLIFSIACVALAIERALRRDWRMIVYIVFAGLMAVPLSATYLHEIVTGIGASLHTGESHIGHARFVAFFPRNVSLPRIEFIMLGHSLHLHEPMPVWTRVVLRPILTFMLFIIELGFFGFVLAWRIWEDFRNRNSLTDLQRIQWALFISVAFTALFLTSQPVIGVNDLGRHAGLVLRFIAILWATPLLIRAFYDRSWSILHHPVLVKTVIATIVMGFSAQIWQVTVQRSYFWLVDRGIVTHPFAPFPRFAHYGTRYYETREAFEALDRMVPPASHVQFNPGTIYWTLMGDYLERPVAAFDLDCQAAFGGNLEMCHQAMPKIRAIFGGGQPIIGPAQAFDPAGVTISAFVSVCQEQHLSAVIATASDRVWVEKQSWLWIQPAMFSNASMRVVACPSTSGI